MAYATIDDLVARFPRALTSAEEEAAEVMLDDASFLLAVKASGLQGAIDGAVEAGTENEDVVTHAAMLLTVAMVKRALLAQAAQQTGNPMAEQITRAFGPYSSSIKYRTDNDNLFLYGTELEYLLGLLREDGGSRIHEVARALMDALKTVGHRAYIGSMSADGYPGSPTFSPPDTQAATQRPAYGWYPLASEVPLGNDDYTQRVISSVAVGVPDVTPYKAGDLVILNGKDYIVSEDVRDFTTGPWGDGPGGVIIVEKVSG